MSTPIGVFSRHIRLSRHLSQQEEADLLGYEQAYVSAIELGTKPPSQEFLARFARKLNLDVDEHAEMLQASKTSRRRFVLPASAAIETYHLCAELWEKIDRLYPAQIVAIRQLLKLDEQIKDAKCKKASQISRHSSKEVEM